MLRVAGLQESHVGYEASILEFFGCKVLIGCPLGILSSLEGIGVRADSLDAVLATSAESALGWLEIWWASAGSQPESPRLSPKLFGTAPVLLLAEACARESAATAIGPALAQSSAAPLHVPWESPQLLEKAFADACEVSFHEQVTLDCKHGPLTMIPASAGAGLGSAYWRIEAHGIQLVVLGLTVPTSEHSVGQPMDVPGVSHSNIAILPKAALQEPEAMGTLSEIASNVAAAAKRRKCVLVPMTPDSALRYGVDLVEMLAKEFRRNLSSDERIPIFVLGGIAALLRRCNCFCEWAQADRIKKAHAGHNPFLIEELVQAKHLFLADSPAELAASYQEPCVVIGHGDSGAAHFASLWAGQADKALVVQMDEVATKICEDSSGCRLPKLGKPIRVLTNQAELFTTLASVGPPPALLLPSSFKSPKGFKSLALKPHWQELSINSQLPRARCWVVGGHAAAVKEPFSDFSVTNDAGASVCRIHGVVWGHKRRRVTLSSVSARDPGDMQCCATGGDIPYGAISTRAFLKCLEENGHLGTVLEAAEGDAGVTKVSIPDLQAVVTLNQALKRQGYETVIEAKTSANRQLLGSMLSKLLPVL